LRNGTVRKYLQAFLRQCQV